MNGGEEVVGALVVAGGHGAEVSELVEEAFYAAAGAVKVAAENWRVLAVRHRLDVGQTPRAASVERQASAS